MNAARLVSWRLARRTLLVSAVGLAAVSLASSCSGSPAAADDAAIRGNPDAPVASYPLVTGGTWVWLMRQPAPERNSPVAIAP